MTDEDRDAAPPICVADAVFSIELRYGTTESALPLKGGAGGEALDAVAEREAASRASVNFCTAPASHDQGADQAMQELLRAARRKAEAAAAKEGLLKLESAPEAPYTLVSAGSIPKTGGKDWTDEGFQRLTSSSGARRLADAGGPQAHASTP